MFTYVTYSSHDSEEADSEEDDDVEASKYRDRQERIKDKDKKRYHSPGRERYVTRVCFEINIY